MAFVELLIDLMCSAKPAHKVKVDSGNVFQNEGPQGLIIDLPYLGSSGVKDQIGAWNASIQPFDKGLSINYIAEA